MEDAGEFGGVNRAVENEDGGIGGGGLVAIGEEDKGGEAFAGAFEERFPGGAAGEQGVEAEAADEGECFGFGIDGDDSMVAGRKLFDEGALVFGSGGKQEERQRAGLVRFGGGSGGRVERQLEFEAGRLLFMAKAEQAAMVAGDGLGHREAPFGRRSIDGKLDEGTGVRIVVVEADAEGTVAFGGQEFLGAQDGAEQGLLELAVGAEDEDGFRRGFQQGANQAEAPGAFAEVGEFAEEFRKVNGTDAGFRRAAEGHEPVESVKRGFGPLVEGAELIVVGVTGLQARGEPGDFLDGVLEFFRHTRQKLADGAEAFAAENLFAQKALVEQPEGDGGLVGEVSEGGLLVGMDAPGAATPIEFEHPGGLAFAAHGKQQAQAAGGLGAFDLGEAKGLDEGVGFIPQRDAGSAGGDRFERAGVRVGKPEAGRCAIEERRESVGEGLLHRLSGAGGEDFLGDRLEGGNALAQSGEAAFAPPPDQRRGTHGERDGEEVGCVEERVHWLDGPLTGEPCRQPGVVEVRNGERGFGRFADGREQGHQAGAGGPGGGHPAGGVLEDNAVGRGHAEPPGDLEVDFGVGLRAAGLVTIHDRTEQPIETGMAEDKFDVARFGVGAKAKGQAGGGSLADEVSDAGDEVAFEHGRHQFAVQGFLGRAVVVHFGLRQRVAKQVADDLIVALAEHTLHDAVAVDANRGEIAFPGDGVEIGGVDDHPVHVEDQGEAFRPANGCGHSRQMITYGAQGERRKMRPLLGFAAIALTRHEPAKGAWVVCAPAQVVNTHSLRIVDLNGGGDMDIFVAGRRWSGRYNQS